MIAGGQVGDYFEEENITENYIGSCTDGYIFTGNSAILDACSQWSEDES